jgi:hypothetical protein
VIFSTMTYKDRCPDLTWSFFTRLLGGGLPSSTCVSELDRAQTGAVPRLGVVGCSFKEHSLSRKVTQKNACTPLHVASAWRYHLQRQRLVQ